MTPAEVVSGIQAGEDAACEELVRIIRHNLRGAARGKLGGECDDALQEIAIAAVVRIRAGQLRDPEKLCAWLGQIGRTRIIDHWRHNVCRRPPGQLVPMDTAAHEAVDPSPTPEERIRVAERAEHIELAMRTVDTFPPAAREVFLRFYVDGQKIPEICREMRMPKGTVKSHIRRARLTLQKAA